MIRDNKMNAAPSMTAQRIPLNRFSHSNGFILFKAILVNIKKTADELHVHYNTLKYRLSKIRDEYCIDFEDLNYIIKLKLSYIALDFISNT